MEGFGSEPWILGYYRVEEVCCLSRALCVDLKALSGAKSSSLELIECVNDNACDTARFTTS